MSTTIDQRVVEMRFDNKHFESNVQTTMSTLDKLKRSLNLTGASKGLESINAAAKNNNVHMLGAAAEQVGVKFSAMQVAGITAISRITNQAMNAGEKIIKALTIDPVKTGFDEYETQIKSVQTILANTQHNGTNIDQVNAALEELNKYADQTIYNFTEMTRNIGTFTAAGVDLDTSVASIKGIANLAAVSGSTSQQASTAMYQLSQALAAGRVSLMDWNSVVNAGMGGKVFQDALIRTSEVMGTGAQKAIDKYGSFRESLTQGEWLTTDVLTETLNQFTMAAEEGSKEWEKFKKSLKEKGYTEEQAVAILKMANNATDAATKVKTFTQLWEVLKESAQSGWSQTWKLLVGDMYEAQNMLSPLAEFLTGVINGMSDFRNKIVETAMGSPFATIVDKVKSVADATEKVVEATKKYDEIVNQVIRGEWGNGQSRWDKLAEAGYNWAKVQNMVNEKLGNSKRHNEELAKAQNKSGEAQKANNKITAATIESLTKMSDAELKNLGLKKEDIKTLRELQETAKRTGYTMEEIFANPDILGGRALLIDSFTNFGKVITSVCGAIKKAWVDIFYDGASTNEIINQHAMSIYNMIASLRGFSARLVESLGDIKDADSNLSKLVRTLKGVFAIIDIVTTIIGGGFKMAFKVIAGVLKAFDLNVLDVTANIGDAIVGFRNWLDDILDFSGAFEVMVPYVIKAGEAIKRFVDGIKEDNALSNFISNIKNVGKALLGWIGGIKDAENIPKYIIEGLANGLKNGVKIVVDTVIDLGKSIINAIKNVLGIHSPSTVFLAIGGFIIAGLVLGLTNGFPEIWETIKTLGRTCAEGITGAFEGLQSSKVYGYIKSFVTKIAGFIKNIDFGQILAIGLGAGMLFTVNKMVNVIQAITNPLEGLGDMLSGVGEMCEAIGEGVQKYFKSKSIKNYAAAVLIMAGAITLIALSMKTLADIDTPDLVKAGIAIVVITGIVTGLTILVSKLSTVGDFSIKHALAVVAIAGAVSLLVLALSKLSTLVNSTENLGSTLGVLAGMLLGLGGIVIAINAVAKIGNEANLRGVGSMILKMSIAMLLLVQVIKMVSKLDNGDILKGLAVIGTIELLFIGIVAVSKLGGKHASKAGGMMLKMSFALMTMIGVIKLASMLDNSEIKKGLTVIASVELLFMGIIAVSKLAEENASKAGGMILKMSAALLITVFVIKQIAGMSGSDIKRGLGVVAALEILFGGIIAVSKLAGEHATKAGMMLILMSGALLIVAGILYIVSQMPTEGLGRALGIVTVLELLFTGMIAATKNIPEKAIGTLIMLVVSVGILFAALVGLTLVDPTKLAVTSTCISLIIGMFAVLISSTKYFATANNMGKTLFTLVGVVAALGLVIAGLAKIGDPTSVLASAGALSALLFAISGAFVIISKIPLNGTSTLKNVLLLTSMVIPLIAFAQALRTMPDISGKETSILAVVAVMAAMELLLAPLGMIGKVGVKSLVTGIAGLAIMAGELWLFAQAINSIPSIEDKSESLKVLANTMAAMTLLLIPLTAIGVIIGATGGMGAIGLVAALAALAIMAGELWLFAKTISGIPDVTSSVPSLNSILNAMRVMCDMMIEVSKIAPLAVIAVGAIGAMEMVMTVFIAVAELIGFIDSKCENFQKFLDSGAQILIDVANSIGEVVGAFIGGFAEGILSSLPSIGTYLSQFMLNAMPFINGAQAINEQMLSGISTLAKAILILTAADIINGLSSFFGGGESSLSAFGAQLPKLGTDLASFASNLGTFDDSTVTTVTCAANAIKALATAASEIPNEGGLWAEIFGDNSITTFGEKLPLLATYLREFITNLGTFDDSTVTTVTCAGNAIKALATAASEIPNDGGLWGEIFGENSISTFGEKLPLLATHLKGFVTNLGTFDDSTVTTVDCAGRAITKLAEAASTIPNEGGIWAEIFGDNSLASFGSKLPTLGTNLKNFATNLGTFDAATVATVGCAGDAIAKMAKAAESIDGQPDWAKKIFGDNGLSAFGGEMESLGTNLKNFVANLGTFTATQVTTVNSAVGAIKAFAKLADADLKSAKKHLTGFSEDLPTLATDISDFCSKMPGSESITTAKTNISKLVDMIGELASAKSSEAVTFTNNLKKLGDDAVKKFVNTFTSESAKSDVKKAGVTLIEKVIDGIESKQKSLKTAFGDAVKDGPAKIKEYKDNFSTAGKALCEGLRDGIKNNQHKAVNAAEAMAKAVKSAAQEALKINSPSKVFVAIGSGVIEGFVKGIDDNMGYTKSAVVDMADTAKNGFGKAISSITDLLDGSLEMQPTIRPVLDLTNVKSSAASINGIFNTQSVGVMANTSAISTMMNQRNQNGANKEIVSAINKLRGDLGKTGNTSYSIGNITYDDGSNIAEAIQAIIRYANIERRV